MFVKIVGTLPDDHYDVDCVPNYYLTTIFAPDTISAVDVVD
jgi:hypothetical protein